MQHISGLFTSVLFEQGRKFEGNTHKTIQTRFEIHNILSSSYSQVFIPFYTHTFVAPPSFIMLCTALTRRCQQTKVYILYE